MDSSYFEGPVLLVGMPRSGTKLLRELLNRNPMIGIPRIESAFIAHMIDRFGNPPNFSDESEFHRFFEEFSNSDFYQDSLHHESRAMSKDDLIRVAQRNDWGSLLESILRFYAPQGRAEGYLWGDKSPNYLDHMPLLKEIFPSARFVHIVRDPRDYCLSNRKTWGKSLFRAAESWRRRMAAARADSRRLGSDYMEVLFESLLDDPAVVLREICEFLDCEYEPSMTTLVAPSENLGDAKGELRIMSENRNKFVTELPKWKVRRIEQIVFPVARDFGYELGAKHFRPVKKPTLAALTILDGLASVRFRIKHLGYRRGLRRVLRWHTRRLSYAWHTRQASTKEVQDS